jgi:hypothetical protein
MTPNRTERVARAIGQPAGAETADGESSHERGEHRAAGVDRDAEGQRQQPQPQHLIDERTDAREKQEAGQHGQHAASS